MNDLEVLQIRVATLTAMHKVQEEQITVLKRENRKLNNANKRLRRNETLEEELLVAHAEKDEMLRNFERTVLARAEHLKRLNEVQAQRIQKMGMDGAVMFKIILQLKALLAKNNIVVPEFNQSGDVIIR